MGQKTDTILSLFPPPIWAIAAMIAISVMVEQEPYSSGSAVLLYLSGCALGILINEEFKSGSNKDPNKKEEGQ